MPTTSNTKPFLTYQEQLELLKSRGLSIHDEEFALAVLKEINYYRLSAYSLTLRNRDVFHDDICFDDILNLYNCDDELRSIALRFAFIVEKSMSAYLAHYHSKEYGSLGYLNNQNFRDERHHATFISRLYNKLEKSSEPAVVHHRNDLNRVYPFWVVVENMSFDMLSMYYKNMATSDKKNLSEEFYGSRRLFDHVESWLQCSVIIRNIAAHGARLYNRKLPTRVKYRSTDTGIFDNNTPFAGLYALFNLLPLEEQKLSLKNDLNNLFLEYPKTDISELGFPCNWHDILQE